MALLKTSGLGRFRSDLWLLGMIRLLILRQLHARVRLPRPQTFSLHASKTFLSGPAWLDLIQAGALLYDCLGVHVCHSIGHLPSLNNAIFDGVSLSILCCELPSGCAFVGPAPKGHGRRLLRICCS